METQQFALIFCAFMVVATVMMSLNNWEHVPPPGPPSHQYACHFDGFCIGTDCTVPLPASFGISLLPEDDRASFYFEDAPATHYTMQTVRANEWVRAMADRSIRLVLRSNGVLKYSEHTGPEPDSPVLAHGSAMCRDLKNKSREQG